MSTNNTAYLAIMDNLKRRPIASFGTMGIILIVSGIILNIPVFVLYFNTGRIGETFLMRAIVTGVLFIVGIQVAALGLIAALLKQNRQLLELGRIKAL